MEHIKRYFYMFNKIDCLSIVFLGLNFLCEKIPILKFNEISFLEAIFTSKIIDIFDWFL